MNDKVGDLIKKIAKIEWIIGLVFVVFETIVMITLISVVKKYANQFAYYSSISGNTQTQSFINIAYFVIVLLYLFAVLLTLYSFYKRQLMVYAFGLIASDVNEIKDTKYNAKPSYKMNSGSVEQLVKLQKLLNQGVINQNEFDKLKSQL